MNLIKQFKQITTISIFAVCCMQLPGSALAYDTAAVSEEDPPAVCNDGDAVYGATCYGSYCDKTRLSCSPTRFPAYERRWSSNVSEEGSNVRYCNHQQIMSGISCAGRYCDNVSIECTTTNRLRRQCEWVGPFSEEDGFQSFGSGKFANGVSCSGSYCDNRSYYVCKFVSF
jgi:hypothetical protein